MTEQKRRKLYLSISVFLLFSLTFFLVMDFLIGHAGAIVLTIIGILLFYFQHNWGIK